MVYSFDDDDKRESCDVIEDLREQIEDLRCELAMEREANMHLKTRVIDAEGGKKFYFSPRMMDDQLEQIGAALSEVEKNFPDAFCGTQSIASMVVAVSVGYMRLRAGFKD